MMTPDNVLDFWFKESGPERWFTRDDAFDAAIRDRFQAYHEAAERGELNGWLQDARGCLALVLILDQFPRNMYRSMPKAFASDQHALIVARHALEKGFDQDIPGQSERMFFYLPFEHSESLDDQRRSVQLFEANTDNAEVIDYAHRHLQIVERFGRFPHRNAIFGRESTEAETAFLQQPGSSF